MYPDFRIYPKAGSQIQTDSISPFSIQLKYIFSVSGLLNLPRIDLLKKRLRNKNQKPVIFAALEGAFCGASFYLSDSFLLECCFQIMVKLLTDSESNEF